MGQTGRDVACAFRDHTLSDLIGFTYASWSADTAADDFIGRLVEAGRRFSARGGGEDATIFVILDGENAWEHYEGQGRPFLRALYGRLGSHRELRTVTMSEACAAPSESLPSIFPGSWINGDFYIWIGHPDDHRAWDQLVDARRTLETPDAGVSADALAKAQEELLIAEGSDWFWWYGDDHSSDHDVEFDELFRRHVQNVYRVLEKPLPEELLVTNITTQAPGVEIYRPTGFIDPVIDGEVTSYFEWIGSGSVDVAASMGAMHQVSKGEIEISLIEYGFDLESLFLRVSGTEAMAEAIEQGLSFSVNFLAPPRVRALVVVDRGAAALRLATRRPSGAVEFRECVGTRVAVRNVLELALPFACLGAGAGAAVSFVVAVNRGSVEVEHQPRLRPIQLDVPDRDFLAANWTA